MSSLANTRIKKQLHLLFTQQSTIKNTPNTTPFHNTNSLFIQAVYKVMFRKRVDKLIRKMREFHGLIDENDKLPTYTTSRVPFPTLNLTQLKNIPIDTTKTIEKLQEPEIPPKPSQTPSIIPEKHITTSTQDHIEKPTIKKPPIMRHHIPIPLRKISSSSSIDSEFIDVPILEKQKNQVQLKEIEPEKIQQKTVIDPFADLVSSLFDSGISNEFQTIITQNISPKYQINPFESSSSSDFDTFGKNIDFDKHETLKKVMERSIETGFGAAALFSLY